MLRPIAFIGVVLLTAQTAYGQLPDTANRFPPRLAPIVRAPGSTLLGAVYEYKGRRLNSPFSVEVLIQELNDPLADRYFRQFRTWTTVGRLTGLASVAYVLFNRTPDRQTQRAVYIGSLVTSVGFSLLSNYKADQAVRRYNAVLGSPKVGFGAFPVGQKSLAGGVCLVIPFISKAN